LYGGEIAGGKRKIVKATGQVTADLRGLWDLNRILSGDARKSREDHRHHAIDAAVLAVVGHKWIQRLSEAAENAWKERKRRYASVEPPWIGFKEELDKAIQAMHISYRPDHRITGGLHKDTNYSYVGKNERDGDIVRVRKPVHLLGKDDIEKIVDPAVRAVVAAKAASVGDMKKLESDPPVLPNKNGSPVPVRKVRIELNRAVRKVGKGHKARYAEGSETHHVEVCEVTEKGKRVWRGDVVSMSEAMERLVAGRAVVDRSDTDGRGFLFSLCKGDTVELRDPDGVRTGIWVVRKIRMNEQVLLVPEHDARMEGERQKFEPTISGMRKLRARKVVVDPLGEVLEAHD
jgi:CRISPR-associated endonuclease Csn1